MGKIHKLPKILINQIAAGEVVERPVSVVKELVENSIDAGATQIKVEIVEGGIKKIIIQDNGIGISKEDLALLTEKHTTSKIENLDDLYNIMTFGFRGEALASISSVSRFKIISRQKENVNGFSMEVIDGEKSEIKEISSEIGTKIIVKDLFYNTPARLNYLKKDKTEYGHISTFLNNICLAYPNISFEFISDGKTIFKYKENDDLKTRIYNIFGEEFHDNLLEIDFGIDGLNLTGFISSPKVNFPTKNKQLILVNKRIINSQLIFKAIKEAYNRYIPHNTFPAYILNLAINPEKIDVNVHPRKLEIRFANEQEIYKIFYNSISQKLEKSLLINIPSENFAQNSDIPNFENNISQTQNIQSFDLNSSQNSYSKPNYYVGSGTKFKSYSPYKNIQANPNQQKIEDAIEFNKAISENINSFEQSNDLHDTKLGKIIGQTFNSYIIVESDDKIVILDQHALAERIIYEKLRKKENLSSSQRLLIPENINLNSKEITFLEENKATFDEMGFDFEILGSNNIMVNSIPDFIKKENIGEIFEGIIADMIDFNSSKSLTLEEIKNKIYAYTACRSAIKFGNKLNLFEINKLLNDSVDSYSVTCPHGRPSVFEISLNELKKKYER